MLFLAHKFLALFQAVRLTLDVDNGAVMQYTIQDGGGDGDVGKDLVPLGESLVGGKNGGRFLIPSGNELEEQVCTLDVHGEIADLVNDEHPVLGQNLELVRQAVLKVGLLELLNELVAVDVVGREPVLCCHQAQGGPRNTTFSPFSRKRMVASSSIWRLSMEGWKEKSKSSRVFLMGKPDIWICFS